MIQISIAAKMMSVILIVSEPHIPNLDVDKTCRDIAGNDGLQNCLGEESYALSKLKKYWRRIPKAYKLQCIADPATPDRTYTFLRDCINNKIMLQREGNQS